MAESKHSANKTNNQGAQQGQFSIQKIYTKDLSFESPNSPQAFTAEWKPKLEIHLASEATDLGDNAHEVVLKITVTVRVEEQTAYLAEVHQAGIFAIAGIPAEQMQPMLGAFCPNILFPFARETLSDLVARGGFPQLLLAPVNFEALYAQQQEEQQKQSQAPEVT